MGTTDPDHVGLRLALSADEDPKQKLWTQPASVAYTSNADADDSWAVALALRADYAFRDPTPNNPNRRGTTTGFARLVAHRNTELKSQQETYSGELGLHFEPSTYRAGDTSAEGAFNAWYFFTDASLAYVDKTVFANPKANCTATPRPAACGDQYERSLRAQIAVAPFFRTFEGAVYRDPATNTLKGPAWTRPITPVITVFHDEVLDAKANSSGVVPDGGVTGRKSRSALRRRRASATIASSSAVPPSTSKRSVATIHGARHSTEAPISSRYRQTTNSAPARFSEKRVGRRRSA